MLDLDKSHTWNKEILDLIQLNVQTIHEEKKEDLKRRLDGSYIEHPVSTDIFKKTTNSIISLIKNENIIWYHCTRITDFQKIKEEWLRPLELSFIESIVIQELNQIDETNELLKQAKEQFNIFRVSKFGIEQLGATKNTIWLTLSKKMIYQQNGWCEGFFTYFWWELARKAVGSAENIKTILSKIWEPAIIKCELKIKDMRYGHIEEIAKEMINFWISKYIFKKPYVLRAEACIENKILKQEIIEIERFDINKLGFLPTNPSFFF